ncbi:MAG: hypothetical protein IJX26_04035 [Clostridia bacterium]|nr:hypothetical protein [Clostridia bacterium]
MENLENDMRIAEINLRRERNKNTVELDIDTKAILKRALTYIKDVERFGDNLYDDLFHGERKRAEKRRADANEDIKNLYSKLDKKQKKNLFELIQTSQNEEAKNFLLEELSKYDDRIKKLKSDLDEKKKLKI